MRKEWIIMLTGITAGTLSSCQEKQADTGGQFVEGPTFYGLPPKI